MGSVTNHGGSAVRPGRNQTQRTSQQEEKSKLVVRFKITCQPGKAEQALEVMRHVVAPSRKLQGVVHFDIARDIVDPNSIIATEVFDDMVALDRPNALPEVAAVMDVLPELLASEPEVTLYHVSSAEAIA